MLALLFAGCSVGGGDGEIAGHVVAADFCGLDDPAYELHPSFFTGQVTGTALDMRVQRGSALEQFADGLFIHVRDTNEVRRQRIGLPIPIDGTSRSLVQIVFYLNETCEAGFPNEHRRRAVVLEAVSGTITFDAIYAPDIDPGATGIEAELADVVFVDAAAPEERHATLSGWFSFFYQRGSPAQRFP
ncbi:MAG TPA: hypothetical protein VIL20_19080 [Sandaracinaceae bacterium]